MKTTLIGRLDMSQVCVFFQNVAGPLLARTLLLILTVLLDEDYAQAIADRYSTLKLCDASSRFVGPLLWVNTAVRWTVRDS